MPLNISIRTDHPAKFRTPLLVLQHFQGDKEPLGAGAAVNDELGGLLARLMNRGDFTGRQGETLVVYPGDPAFPAERVLLVGVGKREDYAMQSLRKAVGSAVRQAERLRVREMTLALGHLDRKSEHIGGYLAARGAVEGAVLAAWDYRELKSEPTTEDDEPVVRVEALTVLARDADEAAEMQSGVDVGRVVAEAENLARELASKPGNLATPTHLADIARGIAEEGGMKITVFDRAAMEQEGLRGILAVAAGSEEEPRFIVMEYTGASGETTRPVALVGKGVTFDTGGISIKPAQKMEEMKYDMSGAAAVLGAMQAVARLRPRINVVALIPCTENLVSGRATKPGDVIRMYSGKTVEVINTDAEGRLILADALAYAHRFDPRAMIDAATLTGAVVIGLGHEAIGLMGNDGTLMDEVRAVGERTGERCWPLPLWDEFRKQIESDVADIKNTGGRPAGAITAGWFLKEFVGDVPWVHLDIAGTAYRDEPAPYLRKGPTGVPTRLFVEWIRDRAER
ncbi:MAG TPA: leucyl aminopeptidase [Longimicrobiales bacterium]|nr:leucyl aminopeptidase [Longimicrobiales bacterium]